MDIYPVVKRNPVLAILRNVPLELTIDYAQAVVDGGISFFEVALNSAYGLEQIRLLRKRFGDRCMIGAGTAITTELVKTAVDAGAQFLLTPGTPADVMEYCAQKELMLVPGVFTPGDVAVSLRYGYKTMKLFPAQYAPKGYLKALSGPYEDASYIAIGGVTMTNIGEFFAEGYAGVGIASHLIPEEILHTQNWEKGTKYIREMLAGIKRPAISKEIPVRAAQNA